MFKYLEKFINHQKILNNKSDYTIKSYKLDLTQFINFIDKEEPLEMNINQIRSFISNLSSLKLSGRSINRKISSIKTFSKFLTDFKITDKDKTKGIKSLKYLKNLPSVLSSNEVNTIIDNIEDETFIDIRNKCIISLLYSSGLRASELISLKLKDICFSSEEIKVTGKGGKERIVFFDKRTKEFFNKYINLKIKLFKNDFIFLNSKGENLSDRYLRKIIKKLSVKANISKDVTPHTFRHTFATVLLNRGINLKAIQELLGHSSISTTQIYTHISKEELRNYYIKYAPLIGIK